MIHFCPDGKRNALLIGTDFIQNHVDAVVAQGEKQSTGCLVSDREISLVM